MDVSNEDRKRQEDYVVSMALMKEMHSRGMIDKNDLLKVEEVLAERFKPIWRYKDFEL